MHPKKKVIILFTEKCFLTAVGGKFIPIAQVRLFFDAAWFRENKSERKSSAGKLESL